MVVGWVGGGAKVNDVLETDDAYDGNTERLARLGTGGRARDSQGSDDKHGGDTNLLLPM